MRSATLILVGCLAGCSGEGTGPPPGPREAGRDSVPERPLTFPVVDAKLEQPQPPDTIATRTDLGGICPDLHPNDTCATALAMPGAVRGQGWSTVMASTIGDGDPDWFKVAAERNDPCVPILGVEQCLLLTVRMTVPAGRKLRLCLREKDCGATAKCVESQTQVEHNLTVGVEHRSPCPPFPPFAQALGLIAVTCLDGKRECATYSMAASFDPCK